MVEARTISAADWSAQELASNQQAPAQQGTPGDDLLGSMDPEIVRSFTEGQLQELKRVVSATKSRRLPIDIRITVPFFWRRYFITVLAGPERRSAERLKRERAKHAIFTFANVCFFVFLLVLFIPALIGLVHILAVGNL